MENEIIKMQITDEVPTGGGGTTDHSQLQNLDYENSGHTGFQPAGDYIVDSDYVHTDNNYTNIDKAKVDKIITDGDGSTFLSNDGTYKTAGGGESGILKWTPSKTEYTDNADIRTELETLAGTMQRNELKEFEVQADFSSKQIILIKFGTAQKPTGTVYKTIIKQGSKLVLMKQASGTILYLKDVYAIDDLSGDIVKILPTQVRWKVTTQSWGKMYFYIVPWGSDSELFINSNNNFSWTPNQSYGIVHKKYVDDKPTTYDGYDASKTQVLKNVNGTLTWVTEE